MNKVRIENFRCFGDPQEAILAPLTLLVGENSAGKTSFMAAIRVLWDILFRQRVPDFKEAPYDLGSFASIVHASGNGEQASPTFRMGLDYSASKPGQDAVSVVRFDVDFGQNGTAPVPVRFRLSNDQEKVWVDYRRCDDDTWELSFATPRGRWRVKREPLVRMVQDDRVWPFLVLLDIHRRGRHAPNGAQEIPESYGLLKPLSDDPREPNDGDWRLVEQLCESQLRPGYFDRMLYASAPVRSKPRRTYDPTRLTHEPDGDDIPTYLASLASRRESQWARIKKALEEFGTKSGLFNEIDVHFFGQTASDPFRLQIREHGAIPASPARNLIDVGYGVSQVLPVITEILRPDAFPVFLFQQPEVHLHPSAQAALGSLFCRAAAPERLLVVETHSDYLLDRVRMDVRDGVGDIGPEDVSILFFEQSGSKVRIHPIRVDRLGNVLDAPLSYRRFFMEEVERSLGL